MELIRNTNGAFIEVNLTCAQLCSVMTNLSCRLPTVSPVLFVSLHDVRTTCELWFLVVAARRLFL
jgi:hypothetical protein